ncbi:MAG: NAD-dependent epimerase/dehydratase family protein [Wenzhouxiangellaceae bacterium]
MPQTLVAVTGGTGFIGSHLMAELQRTVPNLQLRALTRKPQPDNNAIEWIEGDLSQSQPLRKLVEGADVIIHNAGVVRGRSDTDFLGINRDGTAMLADIAQSTGNARFILISSLAAREPQLSHYAASKAAAEAVLEVTTLNWRVVRPPAVYGTGDEELAPLFRLMRRGLGAYPATASGRLSLIHVQDLVRFIVTLALNDNAQCDYLCYEPDDGAPGGYNWPAIRQAAETAYDRRIRMLPVPGLLLRLIAHGNHWLSAALGYAPMLTPGKYRELSHPDWVCQPLPVSVDWQPRISLSDGLRQLD